VSIRSFSVKTSTFQHGGVEISAIREKVVQQKSKRDGGCYAPLTIDFKGLPIDVMSEHSGVFCPFSVNCRKHGGVDITALRERVVHIEDVTR
jgi:hypothetical protein